MTDLANAGDAGGEAETFAQEVTTPNAGEDLSVSEAMKALQGARFGDEKKDDDADEGAEAATGQEQELAEKADAGEQETPPSETQEADAAETPPIEPPRSWTSEDKELFKALPRETQERLAERERAREIDFNRRQQEATEQRKAAEAERQKVEQTREQYEKALPALLQTLQDQQAGEFADVKTVDDVNRLAKEDPFRYLQWDAHQKRLAAVQMQITEAQQRQDHEKATKWHEFVARQNELASEKIPELADKTKGPALMNAAVSVLHDKGFTDQELAELTSGKKDISLQDHRVQMLIYDSIRYREAQKAVQQKVNTPKPVPPVQRPGVAQARVTAADAELQALQKRFDESGDPRIAAQMLSARRAARRA